jgi:hypothetical protein
MENNCPGGIHKGNLSKYRRGMIRAGQARAARKRYREMAAVLKEQSRRATACPDPAS